MERLVGEYAFIAEKVGYSTNTIARVFFESHVNLRGDHGKQKTNHVTQVCRRLYRGGA
jgi:hypothetical protein